LPQKIFCLTLLRFHKKVEINRGGSMTLFGSNDFGSRGVLYAARHAAIATIKRDGTLRTQDKEVIAANGRGKVISRDKDGMALSKPSKNST
jgi:hypothetical protein